MPNQAMTIEQFGQTVKKKYPQYASYSDTDIGERMLKKYPQYQKNVSAPEQKKSLGDKIISAGTAFNNFIGGEGLGKLGGYLINKARLPASQQQYLEAPSAKEVAGSALQVGSLAVPYGAAARGAGLGLRALGAGEKLASLGGKVAAGAGTGALYDTGGALQGQNTGGAGTIIGAAVPALGPIAKVGASLAGRSLGVTTGVGNDVIRETFNAARAGGGDATAMRSALRGNTSPEAIVENAKQSLGKMFEGRTNAYQEALGKLEKNTQSYDITSINDALKKNLEKFKIGVKNGGLDFSQSAIRFDKKAQGEVQTIFDEMKQFGTRPGDRTVIGIDSLKRAFSDLYSDSSNVRAFTQGMTSSARDVLKKVPGYEKMSNDYAEKTGLIKEIQKGLSLSDKASTDTAFRKLTNALRTNNEFRKELVDELDAVVPGSPVSAQIAGQQMSEALPRGIMRQISGAGAITGIATGIGIVPLLKAALVTSPRVVGEVLSVLGYSAKKIDAITKALKLGTLPEEGVIKAAPRALTGDSN